MYITARYLMAIIVSLIFCSCVFAGGRKERAASVVSGDTIGVETAGSVLLSIPSDAEAYAGIYTYGNYYDIEDGKPNGILYIYPLGGDVVQFYMFINRGAPSFNMGTIDGTFKVSGGKGVYREKFDFAEKYCRLDFTFDGGRVAVVQDEDECECGFGGGVYANHEFIRYSDEVPQYYEDASGRKVYFGGQEGEEEELLDLLSWEKEFVEESVSADGVVTKEYISDGGYTTIHESLYSGRDMKQVYEVVREIEGYLRDEMPQEDVEYEINTEDLYLAVTYRYKSKDRLYIHIFYEGGDIYIEMIREGNDIRVLEAYAAQ